ncbi:MAG TPA: tetratricopeptide repeat protein [Solirubrobacterales bacterium]|nr:tetratricopeptide repeat protein [Solirubrobacterales bacterium]
MNDVIPLLKFTPSAQDPQILETITVQREALLGKLVEVARGSEGGARHQLLIGPRGIGKTHILSLVASRVRAEAGAAPIVIAWLEEDPWSITSYEKFLAAIVARVAEERSDQDLADRAEELHAGRDPGGADAEQTLRDALGESRLVLLAENLDEIFRRIGENGQERFRAFAENWQQVVVLATAPQLFEGVQLHESPFYGFFAITHLDELSLESATELMRRIAELRGDRDLVQFLSTDVAAHRLAAIEALAGGHPRIWLLLSGCVSIKAIDELVPLFLEALDDLTPYYQDRLRELGDQQQELVVLLSEAGGAFSNRDLAERSGIPQNQVASMLRHLTERGYVRRAEVPEGIAGGDARMSFWELREPLMRLCLDVKQARGKPLRMIVEFLRAWYGPRLLDELATLPSSAQLATSYASEAFRMIEGPLPVDALFRGSSSEILARAELGLSLSPEHPDLRAAKLISLLLNGEFAAAREAIDALEGPEDDAALKWALAQQLRAAGESGEQPEDPERLGRELSRLSEDRPGDAFTQYLAAMGLHAFSRFEEAAEVFPRAVEFDGEDGLLLACYARSLGQLGRTQEALDYFGRAVELEPANASHHANRGVALEQLGQSEEALPELKRALELKPDWSFFRRVLVALLEELGRYPEALEVTDRGLALDPDDAFLLGARAAFLDRLDRPDEALAAFSRAAELDPEEAFHQVSRGALLVRLGHAEEAIEAFDRALELEPESPVVHSRRGAALTDLGRDEEAFEAFNRAVEMDPENHELRNNLGVALMNQGRFEQALSVFQGLQEAGFAHPSLFLNLGLVLSELGHFDEALSALSGAQGHELYEDVFLMTKGEILDQMGQLEEALAAFRRVSEAEPAGAESFSRQASILWKMDRPEEAEDAIQKAIEADPDEVAYRFSFVGVGLARGEADSAIDRLREALAVWARNPGVPAGDPAALCWLVWEWSGDEMSRRALIGDLIALFTEVGAGEELGRGLVSSIRWMADPAVSLERVSAWVEDWFAAGHSDELEIPLELMRVVGEWKRDRDRSHLLGLPAEQREIVVRLLEQAAEEAPPSG